MEVTTLRFLTVMNDEAINSKYQTEHGLSFWIEYKESTYLFDTGQSQSFYGNLKHQKLNLLDVDHIVLSHGHYDHTGGMNKIMDINPNCNLHVGEGFWHPKYSKNENDFFHRGNGFTRLQMDKTNMLMQEMKGSYKPIEDSVYLASNFNRNPYFERIDSKFFIKINDEFVSDLFNDEIVLCIEHPKGMVVFVGCGHPGIVNILESVKESFNKTIYAVVGGFHIKGEDPAYIDEVVDYLKQNVVIVGTGHCSGEVAVERLKSVFGEKYLDLSVGKEHIIE